MTMNVAALQFHPDLGNVQGNIARIAALADGVDCDLLVIPELASTGYLFTDREQLLPLAEPAGRGEFCEWMISRAAAGGTVVIGGFAELDGEHLYNSAFIVLPDGNWGVYRKIHLFYRERELFREGNTGFFNVGWKGTVIGTMICYDWRFPESARTLALRGADIIAHPSNLVAAKALWGPTMQTRSLENKVITVTANRYGEDLRDGERLDFSGESQIVGMNGKVLAVAPPAADGVIVAEVDPIATRDKSFNPYNDLFADRRPAAYL